MAASVCLLWVRLQWDAPASPSSGAHSALAASLKPGQHWRDTLADNLPGPTMIVVPAGTFWMGSAAEAGDTQAEQPRHRVAIANPLLVAQTETTVAEFRRFIDHAGYEIPPGCWYHSDDQEWRLDESLSWRSPGYEQTDDHPVSCLNWSDAVAYAAWLSGQTGARYRLPSEAEFEYFNRAGREFDDKPDAAGLARLCDVANGAGLETRLPYASRCRDGYAHASPVRSFLPNAFGLYDTTGNLWEFTADCWNDDYAGGWRTWFTAAPADGSAWTRGNCWRHTVRGGSFISSAANLRAARREPDSGDLRLNRTGVRLVREL